MIVISWRWNYFLTELLLNEGKNGNFFQNKRGASRSGMSFEDGIAFGKVETVAACGVGVDGLLHCHIAFLQESLSAVIDEDIRLRIVGEDLMSGFRAVKADVGIVNDKEFDGCP